MRVTEYIDGKKYRTYNIDDSHRETAESFWDYLVQTGVIERWEIEDGLE
jgi:hypothetical protein